MATVAHYAIAAFAAALLALAVYLFVTWDRHRDVETPEVPSTGRPKAARGRSGRILV